MQTYSKYYYATIALWVVYAVLAFLSPMASQNRYNLSYLQTKLLLVSVALPILFIWLILVYGLVNLKHYADSIVGSTEHPYYKHMVLGLWLLVVGLILPSFVSFIRSYQPDSLNAQMFVSI